MHFEKISRWSNSRVSVFRPFRSDSIILLEDARVVVKKYGNAYILKNYKTTFKSEIESHVKIGTT